MGISQQTIADELGLSVATVSRSLQNHPAINPTTKGRVLDAAARLGYKRSPRQRRNGKRRLRSIGVFVITPTGEQATVNTGHARVLGGITGETERCCFAPMIHAFDEVGADRLLDVASQPTLLRQGDLAGLIFLNRFPPAVIAGLSRELPCVSVTYHAHASQADTVLSDADAGIGTLMARLAGLGHRRIGLAMNRRTERYWAQQRFAAYMAAVARLDLPFDPAWVSNFLPSAPAVDVAAHAVEQTRLGVTAWVCANDTIAADVCRALRDAGVSIPADVSVVGYDASTRTIEGVPELTSVVTPWEEMGAQAVRLLDSRLASPARLSQARALYPPIREGGTIAPPAGGGEA